MWLCHVILLDENSLLDRLGGAESSGGGFNHWLEDRLQQHHCGSSHTKQWIQRGRPSPEISFMEIRPPADYLEI
jgi:hypothetical protein